MSEHRIVPPGGTVGILGGGQLGRMLALSAARLGLKSAIYSDEADATAFQVAPGHVTAGYGDHRALTKFAQGCDVVTFEFENVPAETIEAVAATTPVYPAARALRITQDRWEEKSFLQGLGLATAPFRAVGRAEEAAEGFARMGARAILKTRRFGYDGKGQRTVRSAEEAAAAFQSFGGVPCILEGFVDFAFEASLIAARGHDDAFAAYDVPQNMHADHILRRSVVPGRLTTGQNSAARALGARIAGALNYVGVLAVELFVMEDGALVVNEIAPRVHNSGHWTIDACTVSQFEQHIRAVCGWPLGPATRHSDAVMENIIGGEAAAWQTYAARGGALHLYGKGEARAGRKMGHVTELLPLTRR